MAGQWNEEWHSWWDAAWQPTPRWRSALRDREAQSFDWPAAAQQSWCQSPSSADATVPMNADAPLQDTHTALSRMPLHRPTAQLKTLPPSYPGPSCHVAASVARNAPGPQTRVGTLMTLTLVFLAPHLSMLTGGTRSLLVLITSCGSSWPPALTRSGCAP